MAVKKTRIIFRADGNNRIGLGHVVRSLALARMLQTDYECVFAIQAPAPELQVQIREVCHGLISLPPCGQTEARFVHELEAYISEEELVVLDGYAFDTAYQQTIKSKGATVICIDDIHAYKFVADAVVNQAGGVQAEAYDTAPYTKLCLGPSYALLRNPFLKAAKAPYVFPEGKLRLLLNLGGSDSGNITLQLAQELASVDAIDQIDIVVGSAYLHLPELQDRLPAAPKCRLHLALTAQEMQDLMQRCHAAVTSPSGVAYEYCAVGGILFLYQTADNQTGFYNFLIKEGAAMPYTQLKMALQTDDVPALHQQQVAQQRKFFNGDSEERLQKLFGQLALSSKVKVREASPEDVLLLYNWANDPVVRQHSFNKEPIPLEDHKKWFKSKIADTNCKLYIAEADGEPAAHIRFDIKDTTATISYLIAETFRGKGLGHIVLLKAVAALKRERPAIRQVEGLIQKNNPASVRAFEKAGFSQGLPAAAYPDALRFVLEPDSAH